jgi:hypothetical protein
MTREGGRVGPREDRLFIHSTSIGAHLDSQTVSQPSMVEGRMEEGIARGGNRFRESVLFCLGCKLMRISENVLPLTKYYTTELLHKLSYKRTNQDLNDCAIDWLKSDLLSVHRAGCGEIGIKCTSINLDLCKNGHNSLQ